MNAETVAAMVAACRSAGVDPRAVFQHLDPLDLDEYGRHLAAGHLPEPVLLVCMRSVLDAAEAGRCSCSRRCRPPDLITS